MGGEDRDYLFGKTRMPLPDKEEIAEMVAAIIPWSDPISETPEAPYTSAGMQALLTPASENPVHPPEPAESEKVVKIPLNPGKLPAGFTYWGQWIAHDIISPTHPAQNHYSSRQVSPALNMDSLYGESGGLPPHWLTDEQGFFRLPDNDWDCLRDNCNTPLLFEPRNNDNAIILQFHSQWQRIHNRILGSLCQSPEQALPHLCEDVSWFRKAQQITVALFHHLVIHEWLPAILDRQVYDYYFSEQPPAVTILGSDEYISRVPYEFSHAAFRFGHSMVRETYKLRGNDSFTLHALLTHQAERGKAIPPIDWSLFFGGFAQEVQPINLIVVSGMGGIPVSRNIAERNIAAGMKAELMTVQECKQYLEAEYPELFKGCGLTMDDSESLLTELKMDPMNQASLFYTLHRENRLPLWPFLLAESSAQEDNPGHRMGKLGSVIIADVLLHAINAAKKQLFPLKETQQELAICLDQFSKQCGVENAASLTMSAILCKKE